MEYDRLLEKLDINEPEEFQYFENFADLVESDEDIEEEELFQLFSQTNADTVSELIGNYFEDMSDAVPDGETDVFSLMENIGRCLIGLIRAATDDSGIMQFCEELARFICWYSLESYVECRNLDDASDHRVLTVRDAFMQERLARLEKKNFEYDFSSALEYRLDDYVMSFGDMVDDAQLAGDSNDLLSTGYVYDDEMGDN